MTKLLIGAADEQGSDAFYPTPDFLAKKMVEKIDWSHVSDVLEPSAGSGNLVRAISKYACRTIRNHTLYCADNIHIDCIELDWYRQQLLRARFSKEHAASLHKQISQLEEDKQKKQLEEPLCNQNSWFEENSEKKKALEEELDGIPKNGIRLVGDDFLSFDTLKTYDLIIMNPDFACGDEHLLQAIHLMKRGGQICCLLNASTLENPYSLKRKKLVQILESYHADIEYFDNAFADAERKTNVRIAMVYLNIPRQPREESEIFSRMEKVVREEVQQEIPSGEEIVSADLIESLIAHYKAETRSGVEMIRLWKSLSPHISSSFEDNNTPILSLSVAGNSRFMSESTSLVNQYLDTTRYKYWSTLLTNKKFVGRLTSKLQQEYRERIREFAQYEFSKFNIQQLANDISAHVQQGIMDDIEHLFDELTGEYSWFPECTKNVHYFDGWASNKAHKIDKKSIVPTRFSSYLDWNSDRNTPYLHDAKQRLEDIIRVFGYLDTGEVQTVDLSDTLEKSFEAGVKNNIDLGYFKVSFYKKGTMHLVYNCPMLIDRMNILAAQRKNWLPPSYGKKAYTDMTAEEKHVVDEFQGEKAYTKVMEHKNIYLAAPSMPMLGA